MFVQSQDGEFYVNSELIEAIRVRSTSTGLWFIEAYRDGSVWTLAEGLTRGEADQLVYMIVGSHVNLTTELAFIRGQIKKGA